LEITERIRIVNGYQLVWQFGNRRRFQQEKTWPLSCAMSQIFEVEAG